MKQPTKGKVLLPDEKIRIQSLCVSFGKRVALRDVNLSFPVGLITALIGPSGAGKSTLLFSLNRMNELAEGCRTSGQVLLDGQNIYTPTVDVIQLRRRVGTIFAQPNVFQKSVFENLAYGPRMRGVHSRDALSKIAERSLRQAGLWDELHDKLHMSALLLAPGDQQRLCIARALALEPDVLVLDDPTAALDPVSVTKIEDLLEQLKGRCTIILATHNLQQAGRTSDLTCFLLEGQVVEVGTTAQIFEQPSDPRTEAYITGRF